jgi:hypothetical protein
MGQLVRETTQAETMKGRWTEHNQSDFITDIIMKSKDSNTFLRVFHLPRRPFLLHPPAKFLLIFQNIHTNIFN